MPALDFERAETCGMKTGGMNTGGMDAGNRIAPDTAIADRYAAKLAASRPSPRPTMSQRRAAAAAAALEAEWGIPAREDAAD